MVILQPDAYILARSARFETALIETVLRNLLDSNDAAILIEMRQAGIDAIVTEDADLRRAARDIDVYTWL